MRLLFGFRATKLGIRNNRRHFDQPSSLRYVSSCIGEPSEQSLRYSRCFRGRRCSRNGDGSQTRTASDHCPGNGSSRSIEGSTKSGSRECQSRHHGCVHLWRERIWVCLSSWHTTSLQHFNCHRTLAGTTRRLWWRRRRFGSGRCRTSRVRGRSRSAEAMSLHLILGADVMNDKPRRRIQKRPVYRLSVVGWQWHPRHS
jgi:hypothetical protein